MRRFFVAVAAVAVVVAAYWAWPLIGAAQLARAAGTGDAGQVFERVDVDGLRRSLARQIAVAYLDVSGKGKKLTGLSRSVAGAAVTTVADPYVEQLLTPANVMALLSQGRINTVSIGGRSVAVKAELPDFKTLFDGHVLDAITGSRFDQLKDFVVPIDGGHGSNDHYGVHMHLIGLDWKLGGLDLPPPIVDQMARSILAAEPQPAL